MHLHIDCGGRRIPLRDFRPLRRLANGIEVLEYTERRSRAISHSRAVRDLAMGRRVGTQWPPRESYEYRRLLAVRRDDDSLQLVADLEQGSARGGGTGWVGTKSRRLPYDEGRWLRSVAAIDPQEGGAEPAGVAP